MIENRQGPQLRQVKDNSRAIRSRHDKDFCFSTRSRTPSDPWPRQTRNCGFERALTDRNGGECCDPCSAISTALARVFAHERARGRGGCRTPDLLFVRNKVERD